MGKALYVIIAGAFVAGSILYMQSSKTRIETTTRQALYQEQVLAREIAKSANGIAKMRLQEAKSNYLLAIANINGYNQDGSVNFLGSTVGNLSDGAYKITAKPIDGQNIKVETTGIFNGVKEVIVSYHRVETLVVKAPSKLKVRFEESQAGYCSAVYLERYIPYTQTGLLNGLFDELLGVVTPDGLWFKTYPEMLFVPGNWRDGESVQPLDLTLTTGTRMNFFIGVDIDCSSRDVWDEPGDGDWSELDLDDTDDDIQYDHIHHALAFESDVTTMKEGKHAMVELFPAHDQTWRISFEDLTHFTDAQHADVKINGYGSTWDEVQQTYGGTGWEYDERGYKILTNTSALPDFSDQVIEIRLDPCSPCEVPVPVPELGL